MSNLVLIHCQPELKDWLTQNNIEWSYSEQFGSEELDAIVQEVEYKDGNHPDQNNIWEDPDIQLCNHYGIDYDLVNCIEAM